MMLMRRWGLSLCLVLGACAGDVSPKLVSMGSDVVSEGPAPEVTGRRITPSEEDPSTATAVDNTIAPPFIFLHGMAGFIELGPIDYWGDIIDTVRAAGHEAYPLEVQPFAAIAERAETAAKQIDEILLSTAAPKVHLIGHSQGGLDGRYIISSLGYGDRVASLTTIGSPHRGVKTIDAALGFLPDFAEEAIASLFNTGADLLTDYESDLLAQLQDMSVQYMENTFNPNNPDHAGVQYYSVGGRTQASPVVDFSTTDVVNPLFLSTYFLGKQLEGENDGLVSVESSRWGTYLGTASADHLDEIGKSPASPILAFDHLTFYVELVTFLANGGPPPTLPE